jgi:aspartyl-tRNA synthetase
MRLLFHGFIASLLPNHFGNNEAITTNKYSLTIKIKGKYFDCVGLEIRNNETIYIKEYMIRTMIKTLKSEVGKEVTIAGFIQTVRRQGGIIFVVLRDRSGEVQGIVTKSNEVVFSELSKLSEESVVEITGKVKAEAQAPGGFEVEIENLKVLSVADPQLPIPIMPEKSGNETEVTKRLDWRWLDLRRGEKRQIFEVWTELEKGFRAYFAENGFIQIYAPSFMNAPSESGAEVFAVNYFNQKAYLAQSPQFYKQMAMASGFEKVFMTGPVFRAEPSYTTRHMTEFTGWDYEFSFIESHIDVMAEEERLLVAGFKQVREKLGQINIEAPSTPFPKISMAEAKKKLQAAGVTSEKVGDLSPEEERKLSELIKAETGHDFVFVTEYPVSVRPFYHMRVENDPTLTKSFDLLYKGLEISTGAQREHRYEVLKKQAEEKGMNLESIQGYLNFFKFGCPPHGGVGMGPGRMVMKILDLPSVKEATFLPRDVKRLSP